MRQTPKFPASEEQVFGSLPADDKAQLIRERDQLKREQIAHGTIPGLEQLGDGSDPDALSAEAYEHCEGSDLSPEAKRAGAKAYREWAEQVLASQADPLSTEPVNYCTFGSERSLILIRRDESGNISTSFMTIDNDGLGKHVSRYSLAEDGSDLESYVDCISSSQRVLYNQAPADPADQEPGGNRYIIQASAPDVRKILDRDGVHAMAQDFDRISGLQTAASVQLQG